MLQRPDVEWTYREIECRLYKHFEPDGFEWAGYVKIGDEWQDAGPMLAPGDEETAKSHVEDYVDKIIMMAKLEPTDDTEDEGDPFDIDPPGNPYPWPADPDPVPAPFPGPGDPEPPTPGPIWIEDPHIRYEITTNDNTMSVHQSGTVSVETTNGDRITRSLSELSDETFVEGQLII